MQKVYLLLRNNKQSGPYSLEELVKSGVKPLDLIWIEGASTSWCYPAEISELKPSVRESNATNTSLQKTVTEEPKTGLPADTLLHQAYLPSSKETSPALKEASPKVYVSLPKNSVKPSAQQQETAATSLEQKAVEIRARALAYVPEQKAAPQTVKNIEPSEQQEIQSASLEQKAAEIRARALAYVPGQKGAPQTIKNTELPEQQEIQSASLEQKAAEIRARALAYVPGQKAAQQTMKDTEPPEQQEVQSASLEQKAAEIRARALAYVPGQKGASDVIKDLKPPVPGYEKEDKTSPVFQKKFPGRNEVIKKSPAIITVALLLLAGGYLISRFSSEKQENNLPVTIQNLSTDSFNVPPLITEPEPQQTEVATVGNSSTENPDPQKPESEKLAANDPAPNNTKGSEPPVVNKIKSEPPVINKTEPVGVRKPEEEINKTKLKKITPSLPPQSTENNQPVAKNIDRKIEPVVKQEDHIEPADNARDEEPAAGAGKKKKTLTEKIDGFFSKISKKRLEDPEAEKSEPSANNDSRERKAVRRGEEVDTRPKEANLDEFVDVTSKESSGNWMLGVYGLKLVVHNRSSEMVKRAAVEVRYYNEHQELIEKRVVNVNNVPPNKTVTVAAPDHRLADHADLKLLSASN